MEREEVDPNCDEDADVKSDPKPDTGRHSARFSRRAAHGNRKLRASRTAYGVYSMR